MANALSHLAAALALVVLLVACGGGDPEDDLGEHMPPPSQPDCAAREVCR